MVPWRRRRLLRTLGAGAGAGSIGGLAGCLFPDDGGCGEPTPTPVSAVPDEPGTLAVSGADWPMRFGDAGNTGSIREAGPTNGVVRRWRTDLDVEGASGTQVVAVGDRAYVVGRGGGELVALDATDGSVRWRYTSVRETAALAAVPSEGVVLVAGEGGLQAVTAADGERVWGTNGPPLDAADVVLVDDGTAYAASRESVLAVDVGSGEVDWSVPGVDLGAVADGRVLAGEGLRVLDAADGSEQLAVEEPTPHQPVSAADGTAYVGELGQVTAYDLADGSRLWRHEGGTEGFGVPAVVDDSVLVGTDRTEGGGGNYYGVARGGGDRRWCGALGFRDVTVAAGDGVAYVAGGDLLTARRVADGEPVWSHSDGDREYAGLAVADGALLAAGQGGTVDAFGER